MKFVIAVVVACLVMGASCSVVPQESVKETSGENLARVKRGCACGPHGCLCDLIDNDDSLANQPNAAVERTKRSASDAPEETLSEEGSLKSLERVKRGCACGPYGCLCNFKDLDESALRADGTERVKRSANEGEADDQPRAARVKRGCACGPHGCLCSVNDVRDLIQYLRLS